MVELVVMGQSLGCDLGGGCGGVESVACETEVGGGGEGAGAGWKSDGEWGAATPAGAGAGAGRTEADRKRVAENRLRISTEKQFKSYEIPRTTFSERRITNLSFVVLDKELQLIKIGFPYM